MRNPIHLILELHDVCYLLCALGCPISVPILDASRVTVQGDNLHQVQVGKQSEFRVTTQTAGDADLKVRVTCE